MITAVTLPGELLALLTLLMEMKHTAREQQYPKLSLRLVLQICMFIMGKFQKFFCDPRS